MLDQSTAEKTDYELISQILCDAEDYEKSSCDVALRGNIYGFAVKLSRLQYFGLQLADVLSLSRGEIIIDAEFDRLDQVLLKSIEDDQIRASDLSRLLLTIQVKRGDAAEQMARLTGMGIRTVLVAGNSAYLRRDEVNTSAIAKFKKLISAHSYDLLGISAPIRERLQEELGIKISSSRVLELQGYQSMCGSKLWTYYAGTSLSGEAQAYLSRRGGDGQYIAQSKKDLMRLAKKHKLVIFLDANNSFQYLQRLRGFSKLV